MTEQEDLKTPDNVPANAAKDLTTELEVSAIEPKPALKSKTIWGILLLLVLAAAKFFGFDLEAEAAKANELLEMLGATLVVLGIRQADRPLRFGFSDDGNGKSALPESASAWMIGGAAVALACLPSCSQIPFDGSVQFQHSSGAGVICDDAGCRLHIAPVGESVPVIEAAK